jgi:hypothetical protein
MAVFGRVAGLLLMLAGALACTIGVLLLVSTGSSDTDTETLVADGLLFLLPGIAAIAGGAWLLRRRRRTRA